MARIRSIHPGFWTDESVVTVSAFARLLLIGLGNESDDKGAFPWKPVTLKMRLFPVDSVDIDALLAELEGAGLVRKYAVSETNYGAIRNFRKHQSPRTPNDVHPMPDDLRNYVGLSATDTEMTAPKAATKTHDVTIDGSNELPLSQNAEKCFEMEGRGGEGKGKKVHSRKKISYSDDFNDFWRAWSPIRTESKKAAFEQWKKLPPEDHLAARAEIKSYSDACKKENHPRKHAERYLRHGLFGSNSVGDGALQSIISEGGNIDWGH